MTNENIESHLYIIKEYLRNQYSKHLFEYLEAWRIQVLVCNPPEFIAKQIPITEPSIYLNKRNKFWEGYLGRVMELIDNIWLFCRDHIEKYELENTKLPNVLSILVSEYIERINEKAKSFDTNLTAHILKQGSSCNDKNNIDNLDNSSADATLTKIIEYNNHKSAIALKQVSKIATNQVELVPSVSLNSENLHKRIRMKHFKGTSCSPSDIYKLANSRGAIYHLDETTKQIQDLVKKRNGTLEISKFDILTSKENVKYIDIGSEHIFFVGVDKQEYKNSNIIIASTPEINKYKLKKISMRTFESNYKTNIEGVS